MDRAFWPASQHWARIHTMTQGMRVESDSSIAAKLFTSVQSAMEFWYKKDFQNPNWWWNQIGIPTIVSQTFVLIACSNGFQLTSSNVAGGVKIMDRATWWEGWTGANLVWMIQIQVLKGVSTNNETAVVNGFGRVWQEMQVWHQDEDNIQVDGSFHQHGPQLLAGSYGDVFSSSLLDMLAWARDTQFYADAEQLGVFVHLLLDGQQWMIVRNVWDYSVVGREITRIPTGSQAVLGGMAVGLNMTEVAMIPSPRSAELVAFAASFQQGTLTLSGNRHFYDSDYIVHRRGGYVVTVKMHSNRTIAAACVNGEGKDYEHLGDGVMNIYYSGDEYGYIYPVWDLRRLPGISCEQGVPFLPCLGGAYFSNATSFVGGVSDGTYGASAMLLRYNALMAQKSWFFFDAAVVAMGSAVTCNSTNAVYTSIDNRLLLGPVYVCLGGSGTCTVSELPVGNHTFAPGTLAWVYHNGTGYIMVGTGGNFSQGPTGTMFHLNTIPRSGNWDVIGEESGMVTRSVFDFYLNHGAASSGRVEDGGYSYLVLPNVSLASMPHQTGYAWTGLQLVAGSTAINAVFDQQNNILQAVFWAPGRVSAAPSGFRVGVSAAAMVMVEVFISGVVNVTASNPDTPGLQLSVTLDRVLQGNGCVNNGVFTTVSFALPGGDSMGASQTVQCTPRCEDC